MSSPALAVLVALACYRSSSGARAGGAAQLRQDDSVPLCAAVCDDIMARIGPLETERECALAARDAGRVCAEVAVPTVNASVVEECQAGMAQRLHPSCLGCLELTPRHMFTRQMCHAMCHNATAWPQIEPRESMSQNAQSQSLVPDASPVPVPEISKAEWQNAWEARRMSADLFDTLFLCPFTRQVFEDPVVASDGYTYEREALVEWLKTSDQSPTTSEPFLHGHFVRNWALRKLLIELAEAVNVQQN